ncbi:hypothetical protein GYMLUDRAFT_1029237 [Collybiopsis luxurians FD-317 M1]|uniref:DH domain-containing protein n=1 Tax=Collybiopsis luxurians FD-317 M1 TaxID=944289 RepID=A0A0D0BRC0_9AGAR|nr:hypothetical protein GYMLUDRAFT_1029237 [Collybiopsis luxurians FD-317 M1]
MKRQVIIFELIKGEMAYVKDLENIKNIYIAPLQNASTSVNPIIPAKQLPQFIHSIFNNIKALVLDPPSDPYSPSQIYKFHLDILHTWGQYFILLILDSQFLEYALSSRVEPWGAT